MFRSEVPFPLVDPRPGESARPAGSAREGGRHPWLAGTEVICGIVFEDVVFVSLPSKPNTAAGPHITPLLERAS